MAAAVSSSCSTLSIISVTRDASSSSAASRRERGPVDGRVADHDVVDVAGQPERLRQREREDARVTRQREHPADHLAAAYRLAGHPDRRAGGAADQVLALASSAPRSRTAYGVSRPAVARARSSYGVGPVAFFCSVTLQHPLQVGVGEDPGRVQLVAQRDEVVEPRVALAQPGRVEPVHLPPVRPAAGGAEDVLADAEPPLVRHPVVLVERDVRESRSYAGDSQMSSWRTNRTSNGKDTGSSWVSTQCLSSRSVGPARPAARSTRPRGTGRCAARRTRGGRGR